MIIPIHVWIVADEKGITLIDAGMPTMAKRILKTIKLLDIGPLERILLTHGHADHVGSLNKILKETQVPVYAHQIEIPYMEGEQLYPGRKKPEKNVDKHIVQPLQQDEYGILTSVGRLTPYLTPGHSPGHVVYFHEEDQVLLAGDLFTSKKGKLQKPMKMFTADMRRAVESSSIVEKLNPEKLEVCHGDAVLHPANQLEEYVQKMEKGLNEELR
jgi:glyoxylase-like metal-dependent hydrolase (beta-lactamase superfamily II)